MWYCTMRHQSVSIGHQTYTVINSTCHQSAQDHDSQLCLPHKHQVSRGHQASCVHYMFSSIQIFSRGTKGTQNILKITPETCSIGPYILHFQYVFFLYCICIPIVFMWCMLRFGLLGLNTSATARVNIEAVIMIMMMKCQFQWWRKPEYPEEQPTHGMLSCVKLCMLRRP